MKAEKLDDAEIIQEAKDKIKDFKDWNKRDVENSEMQLFLFDKLVEWLAGTLNEETGPCEVVISFFVQKCEVFDAVSQ